MIIFHHVSVMYVLLNSIIFYGPKSLLTERQKFLHCNVWEHCIHTNQMPPTGK